MACKYFLLFEIARKADQLAIKHSQGVEHGVFWTNPAGGQRWTSVSSPAPI